MDEDRIKGAAPSLGGKAKDAAGGLLGDSKTQAEGKADQAKGQSQNACGSAKDTMREEADTLRSAKIIRMLEEMRRDDPSLRNRIDHEAAAMSAPADPQAVLDAIEDSREEVALA